MRWQSSLKRAVNSEMTKPCGSDLQGCFHTYFSCQRNKGQGDTRVSQAQTAQILHNLSYRLVSFCKDKDQTKTKTHFLAKKELANNLFASFSFMRQTGLERRQSPMLNPCSFSWSALLRRITAVNLTQIKLISGGL